jgi:hypothetical protein
MFFQRTRVGNGPARGRLTARDEDGANGSAIAGHAQAVASALDFA